MWESHRPAAGGAGAAGGVKSSSAFRNAWLSEVEAPPAARFGLAAGVAGAAGALALRGSPRHCAGNLGRSSSRRAWRSGTDAKLVGRYCRFFCRHDASGQE